MRKRSHGDSSAVSTRQSERIRVAGPLGRPAFGAPHRVWESRRHHDGDRSLKGSTFIVSDAAQEHTDPVIARDRYNALAKTQDEFIAQRDMVVLDGYIGDHPTARMRARLIVERSNANLAAMQRLLYFPADDSAEPGATVVYTPNLPAAGFPDDRGILVDLDAGVTRVFNADYFGESKMGGLRMWDAAMYRRGGLAMHSGLKLVGHGDTARVGLVVGLSGTGKTTTTFSRRWRVTGSGRLRSALSRGKGLRNRGRNLRKGLWTHPRCRACGVARRHPARFLPRECCHRCIGQARLVRPLPIPRTAEP